MLVGNRAGAKAWQQVSEGWGGNKSHGAEEERLDRAMVAGLMLEVVLETRDSDQDPQAHCHLVKTRLKDALVRHLAGRVTLDRFRVLLGKLDHWFPLYYPLVAATSSEEAAAGMLPRGGSVPLSPRSSGRGALRENFLRDWLQREVGVILPRRSHRKLDADRLREFLGRTQGGWFRVKDFEKFFHIDRKTAWEYLQKLLQAGLLQHNQGRSAAVRYCLTSRFLVVRAGAIRQKVSEVLAGMSPDLAAQVSDWLIATGGESFWEEEWRDHLDERNRQQILARLKPALLEVVDVKGSNHLLRLSRCWLQGEATPPNLSSPAGLRGKA